MWAPRCNRGSAEGPRGMLWEELEEMEEPPLSSDRSMSEFSLAGEEHDALGHARLGHLDKAAEYAQDLLRVLNGDESTPRSSDMPYFYSCRASNDAPSSRNEFSLESDGLSSRSNDISRRSNDLSYRSNDARPFLDVPPWESPLASPVAACEGLSGYPDMAPLSPASSSAESCGPTLAGPLTPICEISQDSTTLLDGTRRTDSPILDVSCAERSASRPTTVTRTDSHPAAASKADSRPTTATRTDSRPTTASRTDSRPTTASRTNSRPTTATGSYSRPATETCAWDLEGSSFHTTLELLLHVRPGSELRAQPGSRKLLLQPCFQQSEFTEQDSEPFAEPLSKSDHEQISVQLTGTAEEFRQLQYLLQQHHREPEESEHMPMQLHKLQHQHDDHISHVQAQHSSEVARLTEQLQRCQNHLAELRGQGHNDADEFSERCTGEYTQLQQMLQEREEQMVGLQVRHDAQVCGSAEELGQLQVELRRTADHAAKAQEIADGELRKMHAIMSQKDESLKQLQERISKGTADPQPWCGQEVSTSQGNIATDDRTSRKGTSANTNANAQVRQTAECAKLREMVQEREVKIAALQAQLDAQARGGAEEVPAAVAQSAANQGVCTTADVELRQLRATMALRDGEVRQLQEELACCGVAAVRQLQAEAESNKFRALLTQREHEVSKLREHLTKDAGLSQTLSTECPDECTLSSDALQDTLIMPIHPDPEAFGSAEEPLTKLRRTIDEAAETIERVAVQRSIDEAAQMAEEAEEVRPCLSGCGFIATHGPILPGDPKESCEGYCCRRCSTSPGEHGPKCEKIQIPPVASHPGVAKESDPLAVKRIGRKQPDPLVVQRTFDEATQAAAAVNADVAELHTVMLQHDGAVKQLENSLANAEAERGQLRVLLSQRDNEIAILRVDRKDESPTRSARSCKSPSFEDVVGSTAPASSPTERDGKVHLSLDISVQERESELANLRAQGEELGEVKAMLEETRAKLAQRDEELKVSPDVKLQQCESELAALRAQNEEMAAIAALEGDALSASTHQLAMANKELEDLKAMLENSRQFKQGADELKASMSISLQERESESAVLRAQLEDVKAALEDARVKLRHGDEQRAENEAMTATMSSEVANAHKEVARLTSELEEVNADALWASEQLEATQQELREVREMLEAARPATARSTKTADSSLLGPRDHEHAALLLWAQNEEVAENMSSELAAALKELQEVKGELENARAKLKQSDKERAQGEEIFKTLSAQAVATRKGPLELKEMVEDSRAKSRRDDDQELGKRDEQPDALSDQLVIAHKELEEVKAMLEDARGKLKNGDRELENAGRELSRTSMALHQMEEHAEKAHFDYLKFLRHVAETSTVPVLPQYVDLASSELLGMGNYGYVLMCKDKRTGQAVVAKLQSTRWLAVAVKEWAHGSDMGAHPHILSYQSIMMHRDEDSAIKNYLAAGFDSGVLHGRRPKKFPETYLCLMLEYMDRGTVQSLMSLGALGPESCAAITQQIASALAFMHKKKRTHNDIKPENILLRQAPDGRHLIAKLADFGLAEYSVQRERDCELFGYTVWCMGLSKSFEKCPPSDQRGSYLETFSAALPVDEHLGTWQALTDAIGGLWSGKLDCGDVEDMQRLKALKDNAVAPQALEGELEVASKREVRKRLATVDRARLQAAVKKLAGDDALPSDSEGQEEFANDDGADALYGAALSMVTGCERLHQKLAVPVRHHGHDRRMSH